MDKASLQWRTLITVALYTQMRRGELIGLNWSDVNLDEKTLFVRRSAIRRPGKGTQLKAPKTKESTRPISLSQLAVDVLRELKKDQMQRRLQLGKAWVTSDAIFTQWNGQRLSVDTPTKWFPKFLVRAGLPHIRFHDLRHPYVKHGQTKISNIFKIAIPKVNLDFGDLLYFRVTI